MTILWAASHYSDKFLGLNLTGLFLPARLSHYPGQKYGDELVGKYTDHQKRLSMNNFTRVFLHICNIRVFLPSVCARGGKGVIKEGQDTKI